jgi:histidine triad (HIT) family protein
MTSTFTRIIRRELPGEIVYETEQNIAFLDLFPACEGHTLVVPKREAANFEDLTAEEVASLMVAVQTVAKAVMQAMGTAHYNLQVNNGAPAGQVVFHVHVHVIPRWEGVPRHKQRLPPERMREIGGRIRAAVERVQAMG